MKITNAIYMVNSDGVNIGIKATIDNIIMDVPLDHNNRHYQAIQEGISEGNTVIDNPPE